MAFLTPGNASRLRENFHLPLHAAGDYCERDELGKGWGRDEAGDEKRGGNGKAKLWEEKKKE